MDFLDTPEEAAFRSGAVSFLESHADRRTSRPATFAYFFEDERPEHEEQAWVKACREWQHTKYEGGYAGISWPERWGGRGGTLMEEIIFAEEEENFDVATGGGFLLTFGMVAPTIMTHGTAEQQQHLARILRGEEVWCQLFSEPGAGSDLAAVRTRAELSGNEWVVTGQKVWTSGAHYADWGYLLARSDPDVPKHEGLTAFIMPMDTPGITVRPLRQMTGAANFNEVFLDEVRIPDSNRLGAPGGGWRVAVTTLMNERASIGGYTAPARSFGALVRMARERDRLGDPRVRQGLADIRILLDVLRFSNYRTMTAISQGKAPGPEGSVGKLTLIRVLQAMTKLVTHVAGPDAGLDGPESEFLLGIPGVRIGGGTDEVMRNVIGERVLGLPGEPRADRAIPFSHVPS